MCLNTTKTFCIKIKWGNLERPIITRHIEKDKYMAEGGGSKELRDFSWKHSVPRACGAAQTLLAQ